MIKNLFYTRIDDLKEFDKHELVIFTKDNESGLRAYIAIHNTKLGPATGGTRMHIYSSDLDAIRDVLNLSKAMSYKCALAGVKFGGGKSVILGDPATKNKKLLYAYASAVNKLRGLFSSGTDVGMKDSDIEIMSKISPFFEGSKTPLKEKFSTSQMAALGVFHSIKECLKIKYNSEDIADRTVAVKGAGKLGGALIQLLLNDGAKVIASDTDSKVEKYLFKSYPKIKIVSPDIIHKEKCDVFSPCALGGEFTKDKIKELQCDIICGGANNQLDSESSGQILYKSGILYAPDYVVNAGGLINVVDEQNRSGYNKARVLKKVLSIRETLSSVIKKSVKSNISTNESANEMAEELIYK